MRIYLAEPTLSLGLRLRIYRAPRSSDPLTNQNEQYQGIYSTLPGHKGQVTTVKLISEAEGRAKFVTGDTEGNIRIWSQTDNKNVRLRESGLTWLTVVPMRYCICRSPRFNHIGFRSVPSPSWQTSSLLHRCFGWCSTIVETSGRQGGGSADD